MHSSLQPCHHPISLMEKLMSKPSWLLPSVILLLLQLSITVQITHGQLLPIVDDQGGNATRILTYIVHVKEPGNVELLGAEELKRWHESFLPNTTLDSGEPRLVYSYRHAIGGFAARLATGELGAVEARDDVLFAQPDEKIVGATTYTPAFLGLNQYGHGRWYDTNQGEGMVIGVIDTGITPTHLSFADVGLPEPPRTWRGRRCDFGPGVCSNKLIGAIAFRSGANPSPLDDHGHGTHTAGTAAGTFVYGANVLGQARGTASGTAPRAHLSIYKVLYNNEGSFSDFLRGIDQAVADGVDVLSMSLGGKAGPMYENLIGVSSFSAVKKGIVPSVCGMNNGPSPGTVSNDFPWGLTVGASSHDRRITAVIKLGNGMEFYGESAYQPAGFPDGQLPIVFPGARNQDEIHRSCAKGSTDGLDVKGKIVLCGHGLISSVEKGEVVKAAGAAAMILANLPELGFTSLAEHHVLPASLVSYHDALKILSYLDTEPYPTAAFDFKGTQFGYRPTPSVASFSGRGPSYYNGGIIKPDIVAPGVNILAAWPFGVGPHPAGNKNATFAFESGTSMATPHVSGIVAMLKKRHPGWTPAALKSAIMTTAYDLDLDGNPITDAAAGYRPASVFAMGAGHVNPAGATDPGLVYDLQPDDYVPYLCGLFRDPIVRMITRTQVQCRAAGAISADQLNYPSIAVSLGGQTTSTRTVTRTLTNVGDAGEVYLPRIEGLRGLKAVVWPAQLRFAGVGQKLSYSVEFSLAQQPTRGQIWEGRLYWVSGKHVVKSPIAVAF